MGWQAVLKQALMLTAWGNEALVQPVWQNHGSVCPLTLQNSTAQD